MLDAGLAAVDKLLESKIYSDLPGWMTPEKGKRVARLVEASSQRSGLPPLCVELGVFGGRGVIAMGLAVKHALHGGGCVHGIDPYTCAAALEGSNAQADREWWSKLNYGQILDAAQKGLVAFGVNEIVRLTLQRSQDAAVSYGKGTIDVLHHDSNHSEEVSCHEVVTWAPLMRPGGTWIMDDINWPSTLAAQRLLDSKGFRRVEEHDSWAVFEMPATLL